MQCPTDEPSTPTEPHNNRSNDDRRMNGAMRRKVGTKTYPWMTAEAVLNHTPPPPAEAVKHTPPPPPPNDRRMSVRRKFSDLLKYFNPFAAIPSPPDEDEDEETPAAKRPRLHTVSTSIPTVAEDAADTDIFVDAQTYRYMADDTLTASPDDTVKVAPRDAVTVVAALLPKTRASRVRKSAHKWTPEEDAKLTAAITELGNAWVPVAALIPDRNNVQCRQRWLSVLEPIIDRATPPNKGKWTPEEDAKLTDVVTEYGDSNWFRVAARVPGRTSNQCRLRWDLSVDPTIDKTSLDPDINRGQWTVREDTKLMKQGVGETSARAGPWTTNEDSKLKNAVEKHNGKNWAATAALVAGRSAKQCYSRWHDALLHCDSRKGFWTTDEDSTLIDAVEKYNGRNWEAIAAFVPGRTAKQCCSRWHDGLHSRSDETARVGTWTSEEDAELVPDRKQNQCRQLDPNNNIGYCPWTPEEDAKLTSGVTEYGDSNWAAVAKLVPDRKHSQCHQRWNHCLDPTINTGYWTAEENTKLTDAVKQFGNNWVPVAALVPGRTNKQCRERWMKVLNPIIAQTPASKWTPEEDAKLAKAVTELGTRDWVQIAAMVPGRTNVLCRQRWIKVLDRRATA
jgi:hypothetical protein